jgi:hypothetical protein
MEDIKVGEAVYFKYVNEFEYGYKLGTVIEKTTRETKDAKSIEFKIKAFADGDYVNFIVSEKSVFRNKEDVLDSVKDELDECVANL